jgi:hypothetical protein
MAEPLHPFEYEGTGGSHENGRGFPVPRRNRFSWEKFREKDGAGDSGDRCGWYKAVSIARVAGLCGPAFVACL